MQVWTVQHAACCKDTKQKLCKKVAILRTITQLCRAISSQLRHVLIIGKKKLVKEQYLLHISSKYSERRPTNGWDPLAFWATLGHFSGFRILASSLHRRRAMQVNQTLHNVWPSPRLVHYIYTCPLTEFCQVQNLLCVHVLRYPILAALLYGTRAVGISQTLQRVIFTWQGGHAIQHWAVKLSSSIINKLT